jgi:nucleoid DNA-binding protein
VAGSRRSKHKEIPLAQTRATKIPAKRPSAKQPVAKQPAMKTKPVKEALTKAALVNLIAEENGVTRDVAKGVLATIENVMMGSIHPRGVGEFTLPGLLKISLRKVPARKAGTLIRNPSTGEMVPGAAKPASVRVKIRALSKLKTATAA